MPRSLRLSSFTLIELLSVIAIIAILAGIILWASEGVLAQGSRSRAKGELTQLVQALEAYKVDNGSYPASDILYGPPNANYANNPEVAGGNYQASSETLYQALSGQTNFTDTPVGNKVYFTFKGTQVGNPTPSGSTTTYVQDPFGFSYGYSTGGTIGITNYAPYNGSGQFDLWSTGGTTDSTLTPNATNSWITNWK